MLQVSTNNDVIRPHTDEGLRSQRVQYEIILISYINDYNNLVDLPT